MKSRWLLLPLHPAGPYGALTIMGELNRRAALAWFIGRQAQRHPSRG